MKKKAGEKRNKRVFFVRQVAETRVTNLML